MNTKRQIIIVILNAILLATGLLLVLFSCLLCHTGWPVLMVFVFAASIIIPSICGITEELSWVAVGIFLVSGYIIMIELFRANVMNVTCFSMGITGGTVILFAVMLFTRQIVEPTF